MSLHPSTHIVYAGFVVLAPTHLSFHVSYCAVLCREAILSEVDKLPKQDWVVIIEIWDEGKSNGAVSHSLFDGISYNLDILLAFSFIVH